MIRSLVLKRSFLCFFVLITCVNNTFITLIIMVQPRTQETASSDTRISEWWLFYSSLFLPFSSLYLYLFFSISFYFFLLLLPLFPVLQIERHSREEISRVFIRNSPRIPWSPCRKGIQNHGDKERKRGYRKRVEDNEEC